MHGLLFFFAGGQGFWWGLLLVFFAIIPSLLFASVSGWRRIIIELAMIFGAGLVWMSGPPLPGGVYVLWLVSVAGWLIVFQLRSARRRPPLFLTTGLVILLAAGFIRYEIRYVRAPQLPSPKERPVAVIGDSLSAGISAGEVLWSDILREDGWRIENFAIAGARLEDARLRQASRLRDDHLIVILLIGGNDLIRRAPPDEFAEHLDSLMKIAGHGGRQVVLVELPFIPGYRKYGRIQRKAAMRHGAILIPRRYLARVLSSDGSTLDGLHLSDEGHRRWAGALVRLAESQN